MTRTGSAILAAVFSLTCLHGQATAAKGGKGGKERGPDVTMVGMKIRNSLNPAAPRGMQIIRASYTGKDAAREAGSFVAFANGGYSTGTRTGGVFAKMKTKRGVVHVKVTALQEVQGQVFDDLASITD